MRREVKVDLQELLSEYNSSARYKKSFGLDCKAFRFNGNGIKYTLVEDENAEFINIFGTFVDVKSGDIALGIYPNSDRYIKIDNIYQMVRECICQRGGMSKVESISEEDLKCIIEDMKIYPSRLYSKCDDVERFILDCLNTDSDSDVRSVVLNLVKSNNMHKVYDGDIRFNKDFVFEVIQDIMSLTYDMQELSREYFGNYILEGTFLDVLNNAESGLAEILEARKPDVESRFIKYLSYGIPYEFVSGLRSYGFGIKQRNVVLSRFKGRGARVSKNIVSINNAEALSSMTYLGNAMAVPAMIKTFNIMELLRVKGYEQDFLFAVEVMEEYKNTSLYAGLRKKFCMDKILEELEMTEKEFILNLLEYRKRFLSLIDCCGMYSRDVTFYQYSFVSLSDRMIESSGRVFERAASMILKKF